ncbi:hypothetical protein MC885_007843, partial [Smutsia gigantea]
MSQCVLVICIDGVNQSRCPSAVLEAGVCPILQQQGDHVSSRSSNACMDESRLARLVLNVGVCPVVQQEQPGEPEPPQPHSLQERVPFSPQLGVVIHHAGCSLESLSRGGSQAWQGKKREHITSHGRPESQGCYRAWIPSPPSPPPRELPWPCLPSSPRLKARGRRSATREPLREEVDQNHQFRNRKLKDETESFISRNAASFTPTPSQVLSLRIVDQGRM